MSVSRAAVLSLVVVLTLGMGCAPREEVVEAPELRQIDLSGGGNFPLEAHLESSALISGEMGYQEIFDAGDALFHVPYNGFDGVGGMRLPDGTAVHRFVPFPPGGGAGAPMSSQSCGSCHLGTASGLAHSHVASDPGNDGEPPFNIRSTTSLFGNGILQLLAQEITEDLQRLREQAAAEAAASPGVKVEKTLESKGVEYGSLVATASPDGDVGFDLSGLHGVDPDLVVRPMGWKGNIPTVRTNTVGAAAVLLGMQAEELVMRLPFPGEPILDADGDGVERELSVGDLTALVVYGAAQETPQSVARLAELGLVQAPSEADEARIARGRETFEEVGCASCHVPEMRLHNTVFELPTRRGNGNYYDPILVEKDEAYDLDRPVTFDILTDAEAPRAEEHPDGGAVIRLYGDLKRHHMGRHLADPGGPQPPLTPHIAPLVIDGEMVLIQPTEFLTPEIWGVGNTGPWMHDGRAGSLEEAIMLHGEDDPPAVGDPGRSEAQEARDAYAALEANEQEALVTFLRNLRTYKSRR